MNRTAQFWLRALAVAVLAAVLVGSLLPGTIKLLPLPVSPGQKHLFDYALAGFLIMAAWPGGPVRATLTALALAGMGLAVELQQIIIPARSFLWQDVGANALGAFAGTAAGFVLLRIFLGRSVNTLPD